MDAGYNDGEALYELGRAYWNSGDAASATTYFQRIVDEYGESDHAQDAQAALDEIAAAAPEEDTAGEEQ
jgi:TolA-binding protein